MPVVHIYHSKTTYENGNVNLNEVALVVYKVVKTIR